MGNPNLPTDIWYLPSFTSYGPLKIVFFLFNPYIWNKLEDNIMLKNKLTRLIDIIYTLQFVSNIGVKEEKTQFLRGHNSRKRADINCLSADLDSPYPN